MHGQRGELRARQSCVDGRETHAATATTPHHHSRQLGPRARDTLRIGKNQRHCRIRLHELYKATLVPARGVLENQQVAGSVLQIWTRKVTRDVIL